MNEPVIIYHYDDAGTFHGAGEAQMSPLEPGVPLIPRNATLEQPPPPGMGEVAVFDGNVWVLVEDHRGETVYSKADGNEVQIAGPGPIPAEYTTEPRPSIHHVWENGAWVDYSPPPKTDDEIIELVTDVTDPMKKVMFEAIYELATRVAAVEGNTPPTRAQFKDWLKAKLSP